MRISPDEKISAVQIKYISFKQIEEFILSGKQFRQISYRNKIRNIGEKTLKTNTIV
jgi:hypothetical protein